MVPFYERAESLYRVRGTQDPLALTTTHLLEPPPASGRDLALRARVFILAANAFLSPALLQRSANERFPNGLANSSGLVGRNLMLHASNHLFIGLKRTSRDLGFEINHGLSLNDFYVYNGT